MNGLLSQTTHKSVREKKWPENKRERENIFENVNDSKKTKKSIKIELKFRYN